VRRGQRQVEQVKIKMGMQMDGEAFRATLLETQVRRLRLRALPMYAEALLGDVDQGSHEMELRLASGSNRGPATKPKEDGGSYQGVKIYQAPDLVLPSIQSQILRPPEGKGM
jgi:hypothetical protein